MEKYIRKLINLTKNIHICTFNHYEFGIGDHIEVISDILSPYYKISKGNWVKTGHVNILLENFRNYDVLKIKKEYLKGTRFIVMLSEFVDLDKKNNLILNGLRWNHKNREYLKNIFNRFLNLIFCYKYIEAFFVLYDSPHINNYKKVFLRKPFFSLKMKYELKKLKKPPYSYCFIGTITNYRLKILTKLMERYKLKIFKNISSKKKSQVLKNNDFNINITQTANWKNLSSMRVVSALKQGTRTLNILNKNNNNKTEFPLVCNITLSELIKNDEIVLFNKINEDNYLMERQFFDKNDNQKFFNFIDNINDIENNTSEDFFYLTIVFNLYYIYQNNSHFLITYNKLPKTLRFTSINKALFIKNTNNEIIHEDLKFIYQMEEQKKSNYHLSLKSTYTLWDILKFRLMVLCSYSPKLFVIIQRIRNSLFKI
jgi:hypothetical protein